MQTLRPIMFPAASSFLRVVLALGAGLLAAVVLRAVDAPRLAPLDESEVRHTLHVSAAAPTGGNGDRERPFSAIQPAIEAALRLGQPVRVRVASGVYRETLDIAGVAGRPAPLLVLEGDGAGQVIVSGSDLFVAWEPVAGEAGRFTHAWPHKLGWERNPWPGLMPLETPGLRGELLFLDGVPLRQVYAADQLSPGAYWVDEEGARLVLALDTAVDPARHRIEVSVRPLVRQGAHSKLLRVMQRDNVIVRGLVFRHGMTPSFSAAVQFLASNNLLIEDVRAEWNSGVGLGFSAFRGRIGSNIVVRRVALDHNGFMGLTGSAHDALFEDLSTDYNNWRGVAFGATGWAPCGWKLSHLERVVLRRVRSIGNHASGGWLDDVIRHVRIDHFAGLNNLRSGLSVEAVEGPLEITGAFLAGNSTGLNLFDSRSVTLRDSVVTDNTSAQIRLAGSLPMKPEELAGIKPDWRRERLAKRQVPTAIVLIGNHVGLTQSASLGHADARLLSFGMRENAFGSPHAPTLAPLLATLRSESNRYAWLSRREAVFSDLFNKPLAFADWRALSSQDVDSRAAHEEVAAAHQARVRDLGVEVRPYDSVAARSPLPASRADALEL